MVGVVAAVAEKEGVLAVAGTAHLARLLQLVVVLHVGGLALVAVVGGHGRLDLLLAPLGNLESRQ
jgi:hypothetical protein